MPKLSNKRQEIFCHEYIVDMNGTQAAIRAGYSAKTAAAIASRLLRDVNIQTRIAELKKERIERLEIDADYVLYRLHQVDQMDVLDIVNDDGSLKAIQEWPKIWRQFISGMDLAEMYEGFGDERQVVGMLKKIKWPDKVKNIELLGKHVNVQAFKERKEVTGKDGAPLVPEQRIDLSNLTTEQLEALAAIEIEPVK